MAQTNPHVIYENDPSAVQHWFERHRAFVERARAGDIRLLFIGDSLTYGWLADGRASWRSTFLPLGAESFGIGGDQTQDVLWRVRHGELDRIAPRTVVLSIGTNDLGIGSTAAATAAGIAACVRAIRSKLSKTTLVVLGILPRGAGDATTPMRRAVAAVNASLARLDDGKRTRYLDTSKAFLRSDGTIRPELYWHDHIHLSSEGYRIWAAALAPSIKRFL